MWYKTIPEILNWLEEKSKVNKFALLDTETTGLNGPRREQLTQISAIIFDFDFTNNKFTELDSFNKKIKLSDETKSRYNDPGDRTKKVLRFNHYGSGGHKYYDEKGVVDEFYEFLDSHKPCLIVAQNAEFDMKMLGGRYGNKVKNEVFDTKELIQFYFLPLIQKLSETDEYYKKMVDFIGLSDRDGGIISSSMSKIGPALKVNMSGYHDALTDCRLMKEMTERIIDILKDNKEVDIKKYQIERIKTKRS